MILLTLLSYAPANRNFYSILTHVRTSCYWRDTPIIEFTSLLDFFTPKSVGVDDAKLNGLHWLRSLIGKRELYAGRFGRVVI